MPESETSAVSAGYLWGENTDSERKIMLGDWMT